MGIEPYLVASSVVGILAQRLIRVIDNDCKIEYQPDKEYLKDLRFKITNGEKFYKGKGCDKCLNTGYYGRSGIYELLVMNEPLKKIIMDHAMTSEIKAAAIANGMRTLREDGWEKVKEGLTTIDEIIKVTQEDEPI